jgi:hypothetical protein
MRIGEVNRDNYSYYLQLLGIKDTKSLDKLLGKDDSVAEKDYSFEARAKRMVELGYAEEGMMVREGDTSWQKIVSVPENIKQAVINERRNSILETANGTLTAESGGRENTIIWDYVKTLPPSERLSASWTLQRITQIEGARIGDYLKSQIPGWQPGQAFDRNILTESNYGLDENHLDITV